MSFTVIETIGVPIEGQPGGPVRRSNLRKGQIIYISLENSLKFQATVTEVSPDFQHGKAKSRGQVYFLDFNVADDCWLCVGQADFRALATFPKKTVSQ